MFLEILVLICWCWKIFFLTEIHSAACVCLVNLRTVFRKHSWHCHTFLNILALVALSFSLSWPLDLSPVSAAESNSKSLEDSLEVKNLLRIACQPLSLLAEVPSWCVCSGGSEDTLMNKLSKHFMTFASADRQGSPAGVSCYSLPSLSYLQILPTHSGAASKDTKENLMTVICSA